MAFRNKLGSLIPSSTWKNCLSNGSAPLMHLQNAVRHMSSQLFVGGLSYSTDDHSLKAAFDSCGTVTEAKVIMDRESGRSRGFGFVSFEDDESANSAVASMNGQTVDGRAIRVNLANEKPSGGFRQNSGGGGGYGGGYGGSSGRDYDN